MTQSDMESLVSGIKQLNGVLVVVMPDCLLYSVWQRPGQTWDSDVVGAYLGELVRAHRDGLDAIDGWANVAQMTVELDEALIVLRPVGDEFVIGYVFEPGTAVGWARLQIQRTINTLAVNIGQELGSSAEPIATAASAATAHTTSSQRATFTAESSPGAGPAPSQDSASPPPMPPASSPPTSSPRSSSASPWPSASNKSSPHSGGAPEAETSTSARDAAPKSAATHSPANAPAGSGPKYDSVPSPEYARAGTQPAADADPEEDMPKGTRLIKYLDAHAPDTHAALLRVSLQTGLPLTLLRMPDSLSDDEFAQVEESVRRILGVEQLNF